MGRGKRVLNWILIITAGLLVWPTAQAATEVIGSFSHGDFNDWEEKVFNEPTQYSVILTPEGRVLKAESKNSASGLVKDVTIDLEQTPYLNWSWRVENTLQGNDERMKSGDDYPARLYVVVSGGFMFWKTRAINYVWSSNQPVGTLWPNAYAGYNAQMLAIRSGAAQTKQWLTEKRNIREDLRQIFGEDITEIHAVAIMTDTDNTEQEATAYYGDIYFSAE